MIKNITKKTLQYQLGGSCFSREEEVSCDVLRLFNLSREAFLLFIKVAIITNSPMMKKLTNNIKI